MNVDRERVRIFNFFVETINGWPLIYLSYSTGVSEKKFCIYCNLVKPNLGLGWSAAATTGAGQDMSLNFIKAFVKLKFKKFCCNHIGFSFKLTVGFACFVCNDSPIFILQVDRELFLYLKSWFHKSSCSLFKAVFLKVWGFIIIFMVYFTVFESTSYISYAILMDSFIGASTIVYLVT